MVAALQVSEIFFFILHLQIDYPANKIN